jgi:flagellar hook-length control protein FliK
MIPASPASSTLGACGEAHNDPITPDGKSFGSFQEPSKKPGEFSALLMLLFSGKLPATPVTVPGSGDNDCGREPANLEGKKRKTDDSSTAAIVGSNTLTPLLAEALPTEAPTRYSKSGVVEPAAADSWPTPIPAKADIRTVTHHESIASPPYLGESIQAAAPTGAADALGIAPHEEQVPGRLEVGKAPLGAALPLHGSPAMQQSSAEAGRQSAAFVQVAPDSSTWKTIDGKGSVPPRAVDMDVRAFHVVPTLSSVATSPFIPARPATPVPALLDQIHGAISTFFEQARPVGPGSLGPVEARFDLHPPELGRVHFHLTMEDSRLNIHMVVCSDAAKRLLDLQQEPWRARFSEIGVRVGQFDVRRDGDSPKHKQTSVPEPCAQALQSDASKTAGLRKVYAPLAKRNALVDVLA